MIKNGMGKNSRLSLPDLQSRARAFLSSRTYRVTHRESAAIAPCKIYHVELSGEIPDLPAQPGYVKVFVVLWWHQIPLGHLELTAGELPLSAANLGNLAIETITAAVGAHLLPQGFTVPLSEHFKREVVAPDLHAVLAIETPLAMLAQRWSMEKDKGELQTCSVVICTRDRVEQLAQCLESILSLAQRPDEIIVVDNAPRTDKTRKLVAQMPEVRYVLEPRPGLSVARNTGIRHCTGEIIAFTDDDVLVHPDWITRIKQSFQDPIVMAVTGLVLPAELETEAQVIFEVELGHFGWGYHTKTFDQQFFNATKRLGVPVWRIGAGANMAFRREVFDLVGGFDERLGAGAAGCSEDSELWYRILAGGWSCRYEPAPVAFHVHRREFIDLQKQVYYYMRGHVTALLVQFAKNRHWGNLFRLCLVLPLYYAKLFASGLLRGYGPRHKVLMTEVAGCIAGLKFYWQHCRTENK